MRVCVCVGRFQKFKLPLKMLTLTSPRMINNGMTSISSRKILTLMTLLTVQILGLLPSPTFGEPAWFQVCDSVHQFELNSADCSLGLWLKMPLRMGCVCVNGVWALSSGFCDPEPTILVGDGDCFSIRKSIHSVKLLGNPDAPFSSATYVASPDFSTFTKIPENGGFNSALDSTSSLLISINPKSGFRRLDEEVCVRVPEDKLSKPVHIWTNSRRQSTRFSIVDPTVCESDNKMFNKHIGFGESFEGDSVRPIELVIQKCANKCPTKPDRNSADNKLEGTPRRAASSSSSSSLSKKNQMGRGISKDFGSNLKKGGTGIGDGFERSRTKIIWRELFALNRKITFRGGTGLSAQELEKRKSIYEERFKISEPKIEFVRETREQTVRMIQAHLNFQLLNQPSVKINTQEFMYFEKARQIFMSVMPYDLVPPHFINGIMRMWRQLVWESHDKFAYKETIPKVMHDRIITALDTCLSNVSVNPMVFVDWKNTSSHPCLNATKATFWNATNNPEKIHSYGQVWLSNTSVPADITFEETNLDIVVELAWKIAMYAQHHCSAWFLKFPADFSTMSHKIDSLFNPKIVKRWHNPEGSLAVLKKIFPLVNFRTVAFVVDRISEAGRDYADQPNTNQEGSWLGYANWLRRPKVPISRSDLRPGTPLDNNRRKNRPKRSAKKIAKRSFWDTRAYCMEKFLDPITLYQYRPPLNCHIVEPGV